MPLHAPLLMPLHHGPRRSLQGPIPRFFSMSTQTSFHSASCSPSDLHDVGFPFSRSNSPERPVSRQSSSQGNRSPSLEEALSGERALQASPSWWAWLDCGTVSTILFIIAMVLYLISIPYGESENQSDSEMYSWLNLVAALLYDLEACIDLIWSLCCWREKTNLQQDHHILDADLTQSEQMMGVPSAFVACLVAVHWDFWSALFFLIPSLFTTVQSLLDPNIAVWSWLNVFHSTGMLNDEFSHLCGLISATLYIFDSILSLLNRYACRRQIARADRLLICQVWRACGPFDIDWAAWGDLMFFVGAVAGLWQAFFPVVWLTLVSYLLWLFNGLLYLVDGMPVLAKKTRSN